jgi:hypothetical protein
VSPGSRRIKVKYVRGVYRAFWKFVGVTPDHTALRHFATQAHAMLEGTIPHAIYEARADTLHLAAGRRVALGSRPVQARLLAVLVESHASEHCGGLDTDTLIERVWPGEQMLQDSARNRLYVAISKLRKAGLEPFLGRDHQGRYRLAEDLQIELRRVH